MRMNFTMVSSKGSDLWDHKLHGRKFYWSLVKFYLRTCSHKLGVDVASWYHHPSMKICKVCNENLVEDECHLILTCSEYKVTREKYDDLLGGHDNLNVILNSHQNWWAHLYMHYIYIESFYYILVTSLIRKESHTGWYVSLVP